MSWHRIKTWMKKTLSSSSIQTLRINKQLKIDRDRNTYFQMVLLFTNSLSAILMVANNIHFIEIWFFDNLLYCLYFSATWNQQCSKINFIESLGIICYNEIQNSHIPSMSFALLLWCKLKFHWIKIKIWTINILFSNN